MIIVRVSRYTGKTREMEIPVTQEQLDLLSRGVLIQKAMPNLSPDQREFIMTGVTPDEWDKFMHDS